MRLRPPVDDLAHLFANNRAWVADMGQKDPDFFARLSNQQQPDYLWIGCSDSRVPANQITGLLPGEVFVHRNVANVVVPSDMNALSVLQFAVDILKVKHIMVCGHYGCGGVGAALRGDRLGLVDNWLRHVQDVRDKHAVHLGSISAARVANRLCELNVLEQVLHVCETTSIRDAWQRGQTLTVHGWIYGLHDGLLRNLNISVVGDGDAHTLYHSAVASLEGTA